MKENIAKIKKVKWLLQEAFAQSYATETVATIELDNLITKAIDEADRVIESGML